VSRQGWPEQRDAQPRLGERLGPGLAGVPGPFDGRAWLRALLIGFASAVAARGAAMMVATGARWMLQVGSEGAAPLGTALSVWRRWDASNLAEIAEHGYLSATPDPAYPPHATAYFPGFPLALRVAGWLLGGELTIAGLALNLVAGGVALAALYRLAEERIGRGAGHVAVALLAFAPLAVFLVAGYSESLFLAGALPAWYLASRGRWWAASLPAGLAVATRTVGVALVAGLAVEYLAQRRFQLRSVRSDALALLVALVPLAAWMVWLWSTTGDPLRFVHDQEAGWGRQLTAPVEALKTTFQAAYGTAADTTWVFTWRLELLGAVIGLGLLLWCLLPSHRGASATLGSAAGSSPSGSPADSGNAPDRQAPDAASVERRGAEAAGAEAAGAEGEGTEGGGKDGGPGGGGGEEPLGPAWGWAAYTGVTLAAYLLSAWYFSVPRGLLGLFPLPLLLAGVLRRRPQLAQMVVSVSAGLFGLGVAVFVRGPWVG
jgi:Mannosyltransferase (PIG-V)